MTIFAYLSRVGLAARRTARALSQHLNEILGPSLPIGLTAQRILQPDHHNTARAVHYRNAADSLQLSAAWNDGNSVAHGDLRGSNRDYLIMNRPIAYKICSGGAYRTMNVLVRSPNTMYTEASVNWIKIYFASRQFSPEPISTSNGTANG
jgi:hypothetical protein